MVELAEDSFDDLNIHEWHEISPSIAVFVSTASGTSRGVIDNLEADGAWRLKIY